MDTWAPDCHPHSMVQPFSLLKQPRSLWEQRLPSEPWPSGFCTGRPPPAPEGACPPPWKIKGQDSCSLGWGPAPPPPARALGTPEGCSGARNSSNLPGREALFRLLYVLVPLQQLSMEPVGPLKSQDYPQGGGRSQRVSRRQRGHSGKGEPASKDPEVGRAGRGEERGKGARVGIKRRTLFL